MIRWILGWVVVGWYAYATEVTWGEHVVGVVEHFRSEHKAVALTLDACGGPRGSGYDERLIQFLIDRRIPATLFLNGRWIQSHPQEFAKLALNPLFEIANHGMEHKPLSIDGKSVYGIEGTHSAQEVLMEVEENNRYIESLNHQRPIFFRAGTAYYDAAAVALVREKLHMEIAGFSIVADAGATLPSDEVAKRIARAQKGDIIIAHMNHPNSQTYEGVVLGVEMLLKEGFVFVRLSDVRDHLERIH